MKEWMRKLRLQDLPDPYQSIAERLGMDAVFALAEIFQGAQVYFPRLENVCNERRKELILEEFDGYNTKELARRYDCSERWVQKICEERSAQIRNQPMDGQVCLEDLERRDGGC